jgi:hypothetical protein
MSPPHTFVSEVSDDVLDRFYSIPNSIGAPFLPGPTHESALALLEVLRHDFRNHHTYVNDLGFHKYALSSLVTTSSHFSTDALSCLQPFISSRVGHICAWRVTRTHQVRVQDTPPKVVTCTREPREHHRKELY